MHHVFEVGDKLDRQHRAKAANVPHAVRRSACSDLGKGGAKTLANGGRAGQQTLGIDGFDRGEDKRLVASIDVYVSDYGDHRVVPNRFQRDRDVLVLTPELFSIDYLRPFRQHALAKTGDAEDRTLLVE